MDCKFKKRFPFTLSNFEINYGNCNYGQCDLSFSQYLEILVREFSNKFSRFSTLEPVTNVYQ